MGCVQRMAASGFTGVNKSNCHAINAMNISCSDVKPAF